MLSLPQAAIALALACQAAAHGFGVPGLRVPRLQLDSDEDSGIYGLMPAPSRSLLQRSTRAYHISF